MLVNDKFTLKATNGTERASEIAKVYRREFDIPFRNSEGAKGTREGYPYPMLDGPEYTPTTWVCATIEEDQVREIKEAFDKELAAMTPRNRRMEEIRGCVFSQLWTKAYGANQKEKREREAYLIQLQSEREEEQEEEEEEEQEEQEQRAARKRADKKRKKRKQRKQLEEGEIEELEEGEIRPAPPVQQGGPGAKRAKLVIPREESSEEE